MYKIDPGLTIEALEALVQQKSKLIEELYEKNEQEFLLNIFLFNLIGKKYSNDKNWFFEEIRKADNNKLSNKTIADILDYLDIEGWKQ